MVEPLRHRQTKGAETDMSDLQPPRHISTLPIATRCGRGNSPGAPLPARASARFGDVVAFVQIAGQRAKVSSSQGGIHETTVSSFIARLGTRGRDGVRPTVPVQ